MFLSHFKLSKRILLSNQLADWHTHSDAKLIRWFQGTFLALLFPPKRRRLETTWSYTTEAFRKSRIRSITSHTHSGQIMHCGILNGFLRRNLSKQCSWGYPTHLFFSGRSWPQHQLLSSSLSSEMKVWKLTSPWTRDGRYHRLKLNVLLWIHHCIRGFVVFFFFQGHRAEHLWVSLVFWCRGSLVHGTVGAKFV